MHLLTSSTKDVSSQQAMCMQAMHHMSARVQHVVHVRSACVLPHSCLTRVVPPQPICRSDVEYKYVVINQQGGVVRWQEGANNTLCLRGSGFLMHVTDSWAHESRQVHEIGVPVPSQQQQRRRAAGGSSSGSKTPAAASPVLLQNNIACFTPSSSSASAAAAVSEVVDSSASSVLQQQQMLPPSIHRSSSFNPQPELDPLSQDVANLLPLLQTELASALAALANSSNSSSSSQQDSAAILQGLQQQQTREGVTPLPAELLATSFDQGFADEADVTAALQEQEQLTAAAAAMAAEAEAAVARLQQRQRLAPVDVFAIAKQALISPPSAAVPGSKAAAAATAAAAAAAPSSSSSSSSSNGRRSPSGSPGSSLASASEDEIAAALLSDDCEEACLCLVDAICSCMNCDDSNSTEPCELDHLYDEDAEQPQPQQGLPAAAAAPEAAESAAFTAAAAAAFDASPSAAVDDEPTPVEQIAAMQGFVPEPAAASASAADNDGLGNGCFTGVEGSADARAEAFGGVNRALQQSADLLDSLSDPTHPLMLKADRELADAKRHMGHLLAA
jgi:hypothetical protein